jgi:hypothetical protein
MNEKQFDDALQAWPLKEVPAGFSTSVMEKINAREFYTQTPRVVTLKFHLTWMDYALGLFLSLLPVLAFVTFLFLPRKFVLYLKYQWLLLQFPAYEPVLFAVVGTVVMLVLLVFVLSLRYVFPRQVSLF